MQRLQAFKYLVALAVMLAAAGVAAQNDSIDQQRQRIATLRAQQSAAFDTEDAACQERFAVTDCQNAVAARRRQMLLELKKQETRLNDMQRQERAAKQQERNAAPAPTAHPPLPLAATSRRPPIAPTPAVQPAHPPVAKAKPTLDAQATARNRAAYADKQKALAQRRLEREQRLQAPGGSASALPLPE